MTCGMPRHGDRRARKHTLVNTRPNRHPGDGRLETLRTQRGAARIVRVEGWGLERGKDQGVRPREILLRGQTPLICVLHIKKQPAGGGGGEPARTCRSCWNERRVPFRRCWHGRAVVPGNDVEVGAGSTESGLLGRATLGAARRSAPRHSTDRSSRRVFGIWIESGVQPERRHLPAANCHTPPPSVVRGRLHGWRVRIRHDGVRDTHPLSDRECPLSKLDQAVSYRLESGGQSRTRRDRFLPTPPHANFENGLLAAQNPSYGASMHLALHSECPSGRTRRGDADLATALFECNEIAFRAIFSTSSDRRHTGPIRREDDHRLCNRKLERALGGRRRVAADLLVAQPHRGGAAEARRQWRTHEINDFVGFQNLHHSVANGPPPTRKCSCSLIRRVEWMRNGALASFPSNDALPGSKTHPGPTNWTKPKQSDVGSSEAFTRKPVDAGGWKKLTPSREHPDLHGQTAARNRDRRDPCEKPVGADGWQKLVDLGNDSGDIEKIKDTYEGVLESSTYPNTVGTPHVAGGAHELPRTRTAGGIGAASGRESGDVRPRPSGTTHTHKVASGSSRSRRRGLGRAQGRGWRARFGTTRTTSWGKQKARPADVPVWAARRAFGRSPRNQLCSGGGNSTTGRGAVSGRV
ncbi:hypothetical protein V8D89_005758 [Ganoderma adspersum]